MTLLYSAETGGFYKTGLHSVIPNDAVEISEEDHKEMAKPSRVTLNINEQRARAKTRIDAAAGQARNRFVSTGALIEEEYRAAALDVELWRSAGSDSADAPDSLSSWAQISGQTLEAAASKIEQTAAGYHSALLAIRQIRLAAKAEIDVAETGIDETTEGFLQQLAGITPI